MEDLKDGGAQLELLRDVGAMLGSLVAAAGTRLSTAGTLLLLCQAGVLLLLGELLFGDGVFEPLAEMTVKLLA